MSISFINFTFIHTNKINKTPQWKLKIQLSMFDKVTISSVNRKRRKIYAEDEDHLKEATGEGLEENDQIERKYERLL